MDFFTEPKFEIRLLPEADKFLQGLTKEERNHIYLKLCTAQQVQDPQKFSKVRGNIWEFRIHFKKNAYRIYAFWCDVEQRLVIATHGILKKRQKALNADIERAERIRNDYYMN